eukprot:10038375-Ditylum_brightwellii.AAC.1
MLILPLPSLAGGSMQPEAAVVCVLCGYDMDPSMDWVSEFLIPSGTRNLDSTSRGVLKYWHLYIHRSAVLTSVPYTN